MRVRKRISVIFRAYVQRLADLCKVQERKEITGQRTLRDRYTHGSERKCVLIMASA
jgi:hypothetical protein